MRKKGVVCCIVFLLIIALLFPSLGMAAEGGGYLSGYENQDPIPNGTPGVSWWSTVAYIASLVVVFLFVAGLAYYVSKILGGRFGRARSGGNGRVLEYLPLGSGRSVCVVELVGKFLILGVTDHTITFLGEIDDKSEVEELLKGKLDKTSLPLYGSVDGFERQFGSLDRLVKRIPTIFKNDVFGK